jgi:hypothetical protein
MERRLAGGEGEVAVYLGVGKSYEESVNFGRLIAFMLEGERGVVWSRTSVTGCWRRAGPAEPSHALGFERWHESEAVLGRIAHGPGPLHSIFYFFQTEQSS